LGVGPPRWFVISKLEALDALTTSQLATAGCRPCGQSDALDLFRHDVGDVVGGIITRLE
jgi:hypothetical protein